MEIVRDSTPPQFYRERRAVGDRRWLYQASKIRIIRIEKAFVFTAANCSPNRQVRFQTRTLEISPRVALIIAI